MFIEKGKRKKERGTRKIKIKVGLSFPNYFFLFVLKK